MTAADSSWGVWQTVWINVHLQVSHYSTFKGNLANSWLRQRCSVLLQRRLSCRERVLVKMRVIGARAGIGAAASPAQARGRASWAWSSQRASSCWGLLSVVIGSSVVWLNGALLIFFIYHVGLFFPFFFFLQLLRFIFHYKTNKLWQSGLLHF